MLPELIWSKPNRICEDPTKTIPTQKELVFREFKAPKLTFSKRPCMREKEREMCIPVTDEIILWPIFSVPTLISAELPRNL